MGSTRHHRTMRSARTPLVLALLGCVRVGRGCSTSSSHSTPIPAFATSAGKFKLVRHRPCHVGRAAVFPLQADLNEETEGQPAQTENNLDPIDATALERIQVLTYRTALTLVALGYAGLALSQVLGGGGTGLPEESLRTIETVSGLTVGWAAGASALLAPRTIRRGRLQVERYDGAHIVRLLDGVLPIVGSSTVLLLLTSGFISGAATAYFAAALGVIQHGVVSVAIASICAREIAYFGLGYKVEAAVGLGLVLSTLATQYPPPLALSAGVGLSLLVLSVAKVFEPVMEDLRPGQSAFFADGDGNRQ